MRIKIAENGEKICPGTVYFAPDDLQMLVRNQRIVLDRLAPSEGGLKPCVGYLFRSLGPEDAAKAIGILLTGMGKDGARELGEMKKNGAISIVQDRESSVVHGMPGEAIKIGAAQHVLPPSGIARLLLTLASDYSVT